MGTTAQDSRVALNSAKSVPAADDSATSRRLGASAPNEPILGEVPVIAGNAGDHALVHRLLLAVHQAPSVNEFQASLDHPRYEPCDRLLIKSGSQIVGHVQLLPRQIQFGAIELPTTALEWLAVLPEYQSAGYCRQLLEVAESEARTDGAELITTTDTAPERINEANGWTRIHQQSFSSAATRDLLPHLTHRPQPTTLCARVWRHVELAALVDTYAQHTAGASGTIVRNETYWHWLCSRKAFSQIIIAIEGDDTLDFGPNGPKIVGYAVMSGQRVIEMMTLPTRRAAMCELLTRACRDALERDYDTIFLHAPPEHPLHELFVAAGGALHASSDRFGPPQRVKVLEPASLVRRCYPVMHGAAKAAGLVRPLHLGFQVEETLYRLTLTRRSVQLAAQPPERVDVQLSRAQFSRMLLGGLDIPAAAADGLIRLSHRSVEQVLVTLFPKRTIWQSPLDDLPAA